MRVSRDQGGENSGVDKERFSALATALQRLIMNVRPDGGTGWGSNVSSQDLEGRSLLARLQAT
jgi:hypothetical protein